MRSATGRRILGILAIAFVAGACRNSSPAAPDLPSVVVATGPQVLRITYAGQCVADAGPLFALIYTRVTVARSGNEWVATASSPASGSVELRFSQTRPVVMTSMLVEGTISGVALHIPDVLPGPPMTNVSVNFGTDGRSVIQGVAFAPSSLTPVAGVSGTGIGTITVNDGQGRSCAGSTFSW